MEKAERIKTLFEHWLEHNKEHAESYREWSEKLEREGKEEVSFLLMEIYKKTTEITDLFKKALDLL